jgi:hypothetical protein
MAEAAPGMTLARPIRNAEGAILCPAGMVLTPTSIQRLEKTGVETFYVEGGEDDGPTPEERIAQLSRRFMGISEPIMLDIKAIVENHFRNAIAQKRP